MPYPYCACRRYDLRDDGKKQVLNISFLIPSFWVRQSFKDSLEALTKLFSESSSKEVFMEAVRLLNFVAGSCKEQLDQEVRTGVNSNSAVLK